MSLLPGPLANEPFDRRTGEYVLPSGLVAITQYLVAGIRTGDDGEDYLIVMSPLRYTYREALELQAEVDPEGTNTAILWTGRTFDPVTAPDLLASHRARAALAKAKGVAS